MRLHLLYICMLVSPLVAMASDADSALVEHTLLARVISAYAERNPAIHGAAYSASFSQLALGVDYQHQSEAFVLQLGSGYTLPYAGVDTYLRLSQSTAVWGSASYMAGIQKDVKSRPGSRRAKRTKAASLHLKSGACFRSKSVRS